MLGDGNGWVHCAAGHRHWGIHGAAGVLVISTDTDEVLLQHRAAWTHEGGTWALPGGARDSDEDALATAVREAGEETTLDVHALRPLAELVDDHGGWAYTTVLAAIGGRPEVLPANGESDQLAWWSTDRVPALALHYGFAAVWPALLALLRSAEAPG